VADIGPGQVLVMSGAALTAETHLLHVFITELVLARRRAQQAALQAAAQRPAASTGLQATR
jgi:hypothetical protein